MNRSRRDPASLRYAVARASIVKQITERKVFASGKVQGVEDFGLGIKSQSSALCGTRDHFVRKLVC